MPSKRIAHARRRAGPATSTLTRLSPVPYSSTSRWRASRLVPRLVESDARTPSRRASTMLAVQPWSFAIASPHGSTAPSRMRDVGVRARRDRDRPRGSIAEAVAVDAHAERRVEREALRRQLGQADAALRAGARLGCTRARAPRPRRRRSTDQPALPSRSAVSTESVSRARVARRRCVTRSITSSIVCFFFLSSAVDVLEPHDHAVDAHAHEAGLARLVEQLAELALAVLGLAARAASTLRLVGQRQRARRRSRPAERAATGAAALVAALLAGARVEHAQVVVDLGDRADGRARVRRRRLLLDRDRRRQPADALVLRLLHLAEELARVRRQRLDVAALALGVERVERERRLARARRRR